MPARLLRGVAALAGRVVPVLVGVSLLAFALVHAIPGDPAVIAAGLESSPETVERIRRDLGLDRPLPEQFARFAWRALHGEFGVSIRTGVPVSEELAARLPITAGLALAGVAVAVLLGVPLGTGAALLRGTRGDGLLMAVALVAVSTPSYWLALMLVLLFSLALRALPGFGVGTPAHFVLPVLTLGLQSAGIVARMTRAALADVLGEEFVRAARARGLSRTRAVLQHALRAALPPVVTLIALRVGGLLAGTVLVESVFAIPGLGRLMVDAVAARDLPVIQGGVLVIAALFVTVNALADALVPWLDPRARA